MVRQWIERIPVSDLEEMRAAFGSENRDIAAGTRPAVVVVDMTKAFIDSRFTSGCSETGYPARDANVSLIKLCRKLNVPVFFTKSRPDGSPPIRGHEAARWHRPSGDVLMPGATGDEFTEELRPLDEDTVIYKWGRPSAFFGTPLISYLRRLGTDTVIVTGMVTSGCVRATAVDAWQYDFHVIIPEECVADRSRISHAVTLFDLHMKQVDVTSLDGASNYLRSAVL